MISFVHKGNLLDADVEALVNTVNEVGVMGKGIALMFSEAYPENTRAYAEACRTGEVRVGRMFVTDRASLLRPQWIINFPTKKHWRGGSRLEWVRDGLDDLVRVIREHGIRSVALPPLGCGNGGLEWTDVRPLMESALGALGDVNVVIYEPSQAYHAPPKKAGVTKLTPARALIVEMIRRYTMVDPECANVEVQKLAWFLHRSIKQIGLSDPLRLTFTAHIYGPYADALRHLLNELDGSFLHSEKRLADAGPLDRLWVADERRSDVESYLESDDVRQYLPALDVAEGVIEGFQSPLEMELLATVDWLLSETGCEASVGAIREGLAHWPGGPDAAARKLRLFDDRLIALALNRLRTIEPEVAV